VSGRRLLICESPGKIKTLRGILGAGWDVQASLGHVTELADDGEDHLGFDLGESGITCRYVPRGAQGAATLRKLRAAAAAASEVYLATDPDREGEAIAWHLARELRLKAPRRITYTQITQAAVQAALRAPRTLDLDLISAQRARQCLDKLVGYRVSPLLWRSTGGRSAGRVQSAALHLACEREREIAAFVPVDYWSVWVDYAEGFRAFYRGEPSVEEEATPTTDDAAGRQAAAPESTRVLSEAAAEALVAAARSHPHRVLEVYCRDASKASPPPFVTSALQQAAGALLGMSPERTMRIAQELYEGIDLPGGRKGLITYMRTDSPALAPEFVEAVRGWLGTHSPESLPARAPRHRGRSAVAQEAHEAIRPTDVALTPRTIRPHLGEEQLRLYDLIWRRAVASQCTPARLEKTTIVTRSGEVHWQARGMRVVAPGYTKFWNDLQAEVVLPALEPDQPLTLDGAAHEKKRTQPPPRYGEPRLVQLMERRGIGRPSTYAATIRTLKERGYLTLEGRALVPTPLGLATDELVGRAIPDLVDCRFTAAMEESLDEIAAGRRPWETYLLGWNRDYLAPALERARQFVVAEFAGRPARASATPRQASRTPCPSCGKPLVKVPSKKVKRGHFLKCESCPDVVLFWSTFRKRWERPAAAAEEGTPPAAPNRTLATPTAFSCPVCGKPLEEYPYLKDGQTRRLLRCSTPAARTDAKHRDVAFFQSPSGIWWSKRYGELR